ncbi:DNA glycosylase AlkZ-like family protein [Melissospora conviva]|uniref:DNA glycosylase AlkZ-like family protein n=1 Tax=Melissospora conviva TaxID=3388432 RepID=UPI003B77BBE1
MTLHRLSIREARRIAVRAQLLDGARPGGLVEMVRHLTLLQIDPTAAVAPTADLVCWSRLGRDRLWDLAERIYPDEPMVPPVEALRRRDQRRLRALGIARARTTKVPIEPYDVGEAGEPAVVEGVPGPWRVDPAQLGQPFNGRSALLSPFDRLVHDRRRALELFDFDYGLEMYKPATRRRWGYYALPILHGDRLVGNLDAKADRKAGVLRVNAVHEDEPFGADVTAAVDGEIAALADWLQLELVRG